MKIKLAIFAMTVLSLMVLSGCNQSNDETEKKEEETSTPVSVGEVEVGNFYTEKSVYGRTEPDKQTPIMMDQPGELETLNVENGDEVEKDEHIATVKTQVGEQKIKAPADGVVASLDASEDSIVSNENPLMMILELDKVKATFSVTSSMRALFDKGDEVNVYVEDEKYKGEILALDTLPDDTGQYPIQLEFDNKDNAVLPGMTTKLVVQKLEEKDAIILPAEAIVTQTDENYVFIADGNHAKRIEVEILSSQSEKVAVEAELDEADDIIIEGQHTLADGSLIDVKEGSAQ